MFADKPRTEHLFNLITEKFNNNDFWKVQFLTLAIFSGQIFIILQQQILF